MRRFSFLALLVCALSTLLSAADSPLLLRFPTISKTQIVFNYAGDLWIVSRDGGEARQLTTGTGVEKRYPISPRMAR